MLIMGNKQFQRFNHSYTHCEGEGCEFCSDCVHHLAFVEAIKQGIKNIKIIKRCNNLEQMYVRVKIEKAK